MIKQIILITLCLIPAAALAEPPGQHPQKSPHSGPPFKKPTSRPADDPQELNQALQFLERMSPNRYKAYQSLDDDRKWIFRDRILAFYRGNQWMNWGPGNDMRIAREKVLKGEDDVFAVRWKIAAAGGPRKATDADKEDLRKAVKELVGAQLQERAIRLEGMKKYVKQEEDSIARAQANPDDAVEERYQDELDGRGLGLFDHPRRRENTGGGGPGGPPGGPGGEKNPRRETQPSK